MLAGKKTGMWNPSSRERMSKAKEWKNPMCCSLIYILHVLHHDVHASVVSIKINKRANARDTARYGQILLLQSGGSATPPPDWMQKMLSHLDSQFVSINSKMFIARVVTHLQEVRQTRSNEWMKWIRSTHACLCLDITQAFFKGFSTVCKVLAAPVDTTDNKWAVRRSRITLFPSGSDNDTSRLVEYRHSSSIDLYSRYIERVKEWSMLRNAGLGARQRWGEAVVGILFGSRPPRQSPAHETEHSTRQYTVRIMEWKTRDRNTKVHTVHVQDTV